MRRRCRRSGGVWLNAAARPAVALAMDAVILSASRWASAFNSSRGRRHRSRGAHPIVGPGTRGARLRVGASGGGMVITLGLPSNAANSSFTLNQGGNRKERDRKLEAARARRAAQREEARSATTPGGSFRAQPGLRFTLNQDRSRWHVTLRGVEDRRRSIDSSHRWRLDGARRAGFPQRREWPHAVEDFRYCASRSGVAAVRRRDGLSPWQPAIQLGQV